MIKNDDTIKREWQELDSTERILSLIRGYEFDVHKYLAETVAAICNVDVDEMLSDCDKIYVAQARWLFWYAYRYMTGETYEKIAELTKKHHSYARVSVGQAVNKMSALIESEPIWKKRWTIIKRIIKLREASSDSPVDNTIVIQVPREIKDKLNIIIKDK